MCEELPESKLLSVELKVTLEVLILGVTIFFLGYQNHLIRGQNNQMIKQTDQLVKQTSQLVEQNKRSIIPLLSPASGPDQSLVENIGNGPTLNIVAYKVSRSLTTGDLSFQRSINLWYGLGRGDKFSTHNFNFSTSTISSKEFYQEFPDGTINLKVITSKPMVILKYSDMFYNCYATIILDDKTMGFNDLGTCTYTNGI